MNKIIKFLKKNALVVIALSVTACIYILFYALKAECPIKHIFGISCAGCGMTRALLSALRLDFASAFYYHPLWFAVIPDFALLLILYCRKKEKAFSAALIASVASLLAVYIVRLLFGDGNVVVFEPMESAIAKAFSKFFGSF